MPRVQRKKSKTGYYHIILRGNEKKEIFLDNEDRWKFLDIISHKKQDNSYSLYSFCLMDNHVHLLIKEDKQDIAKIMQKIAVSYVSFFNQKYKRVGHLFQDRFRSEPVESDSYLLSLIRYIHQNPVKAKMVKSTREYKWSSYNTYLTDNDHFRKIINPDSVLRIFSDNLQNARELYQEFMNTDSKEKYLDITEEEVMDENRAKALYRLWLENGKIRNNQPISDETIKEFKKATGLSCRKIAGITGVNKSRINRILREE